MGFSFKKVFSKKGLSHLAVAAGSGGMLPGFAEAQFFDKGQSATEGVVKGVGNLVTGGYIAQKEATEEAKKSRDQAKDQYQTSADEATAEAARIANLEEERKRRLLLYGTQNPSTLMGSYTGLPGQANVGRSTLG